jgi:hypothetical protein
MAIQFHPVPHGVTWTHYRVVSESPDGFDAETDYSMNVHYAVTGSDGNFTVRNVATSVTLDAQQSWVVRGLKTPALLGHEALHYLIATLIGRELDQEVAQIVGDDAASIQSAVDALIADKTARALAIGEAYDSDTSHGTDAGQQAAWVAKVHDWERNQNQVVWP